MGTVAKNSQNEHVFIDVGGVTLPFYFERNSDTGGKKRQNVQGSLFERHESLLK
jgi:hypothetical protein